MRGTVEFSRGVPRIVSKELTMAIGLGIGILLIVVGVAFMAGLTHRESSKQGVLVP